MAKTEIVFGELGGKGSNGYIAELSTTGKITLGFEPKSFIVVFANYNNVNVLSWYYDSSTPNVLKEIYNNTVSDVVTSNRLTISDGEIVFANSIKNYLHKTYYVAYE